MKTLVARNTEFKDGSVRICIPVTGITEKEIYSQTEEAINADADLIEWRADWFEGVHDLHNICHVLRQLRSMLDDIPLLFTFRTVKEGGKTEISVSEYENLLYRAINSGSVDLVDIELFVSDEVTERLVSLAREHNVLTVISSHDFEKTPDTAEMIRRLERMKELGADLPKLAVMPQTKKDVFWLMGAAAQFTSSNDCPCIAISMAKEGKISRIASESFGSVITFGCAGRASAPGQIPEEELRSILDQLHNTL